MRIHLIKNGVVENTIDDESVEKVQALFPSHVVVASDSGGPGWRYEGGQVLPPVVPELPPTIPHSVTRRQALQQLRIEGFTEDQIIANINAMMIPQLNKDLALIEFKESQVFERNRPLVAQLGAMLGKDEAGIDAMFIAASKL